MHRSNIALNIPSLINSLYSKLFSEAPKLFSTNPSLFSRQRTMTNQITPPLTQFDCYNVVSCSIQGCTIHFLELHIAQFNGLGFYLLSSILNYLIPLPSIIILAFLCTYLLKEEHYKLRPQYRSLYSPPRILSFLLSGS